ncbi:MAG: hypothetical protein KJ622_12860 [Alphaproteobacteria bacterium]|nr:hypothetical protein [Alphaproteobacteria bacterium]
MIILVAVLAGCASVPTGADPQLRAQIEDFNQTIAEGAVAGAVVGGLVGAVKGRGDPRYILAGVAAGAAVGGAAGFMVAGQKAQYASKEEALAGLTEDAESRVTKLTGLVSSADRLVAQRRQEVDALKIATAEAHSTAKQRATVLSQLQADKAAMDIALKAADKHSTALAGNIAHFNSQYPGQQPGQLPALASSFESQKTALNDRSMKMAAMIKELE